MFKIILLFSSVFCAAAFADPIVICHVEVNVVGQDTLDCGSATLNLGSNYQRGVGVCKDVNLEYFYQETGHGRIWSLLVARKTDRYDNDEPSIVSFPDHFPAKFYLSAFFSDATRNLTCTVEQ